MGTYLCIVRAKDKASSPVLFMYGGFMQICEEFWDEFMRWAVPFAKVKPDADIYDVFVWIREHTQGASPYSDSLLAKIDKEIERELGPWT